MPGGHPFRRIRVEEDEETMLRGQEEFLAANKVRQTGLIDAHHEERDVQGSPRGIMQMLQYENGNTLMLDAGGGGIAWKTSGKIV